MPYSGSRTTRYRVAASKYPRDRFDVEKVGRPSLRAYARAERSLWKEGPVSLVVLQQRTDACMACSFRDPNGDAIGFCTKCGCGDRERARLSNKLHMPKASCPLKGKAQRWGESVGEGLHALARLPGGVTGQMRSVVKGAASELLRRYRSWRLLRRNVDSSQSAK